MNDKGRVSSEASGMRASPDGSVVKPAGSLNSIFSELVQAEDDTVGLLGYALYKQNKRDWLIHFFKDQEREATGGELLAYHLGERSPRRLQTYRRLAVDILARDAGGRDGEGFAGKFVGTSSDEARRAPSLTEAIIAQTWSKVLVGLLAVIGLVAIIVVALSFVSPGLLRDILPGQSIGAPATPAKP
jgi:hypothetical protein